MEIYDIFSFVLYLNILGFFGQTLSLLFKIFSFWNLKSRINVHVHKRPLQAFFTTQMCSAYNIR